MRCHLSAIAIGCARGTRSACRRGGKTTDRIHGSDSECHRHVYPLKRASDNFAITAQAAHPSASLPAHTMKKMAKKKDLTLREHLKTIQSDGGKARWANLTPEERSAQARKIVAARWAKKADAPKPQASKPARTAKKKSTKKKWCQVGVRIVIPQVTYNETSQAIVQEAVPVHRTLGLAFFN